MSDPAGGAAPGPPSRTESFGPARGDGFIPLSVPVMGGNEGRYLAECVETGWVSSGGPFVTRFEDALREVTGSPHAVACNTGTAAIHVALVALGVGRGDAVIVPTLTFVATVNAVAYTGATPIFMDCDEHLGMDAVKTASFLAEECSVDAHGHFVHVSSGLRVRALLPVHVFGDPCDLAPLRSLATGYGIALVEDAAESLGSSWTEGELAGRHTGTVGTLGALSFNGNKICTAGGGGMVLTADGALADRVRHLTTQAKADTVRFVHDEVGYNYRLTSVQAALGLAQVERLAEFVGEKGRIHARYREGLEGVAGIRLLEPPPGTRSNHWLNAVLLEAGLEERERVMARLESAGIQTRPVWFLNHRQAPFASAPAYRIERADHMWERVLNVPSTSDLSDADVDRVVAALREAVQ